MVSSGHRYVCSFRLRHQAFESSFVCKTNDMFVRKNHHLSDMQTTYHSSCVKPKYATVKSSTTCPFQSQTVPVFSYLIKLRKPRMHDDHSCRFATVHTTRIPENYRYRSATDTPLFLQLLLLTRRGID